MASNPLAPPPPSGDEMGRWLFLLWKRLTATGQILWSTISFSGSNITDIETRNHADLQNLDTTNYAHLTAAEVVDLTDGGDTTLHYHAADRARANHTGTQTLASISDAGTMAAQNANAVNISGGSATLTTLNLDKTITAGGTTGAQTIDKPAGSVNFAALATSLVVTNSLAATSSVILATVATNDATMTSVQVVAGAGSFTIYANAAATAETRVNFLVLN